MQIVESGHGRFTHFRSSHSPSNSTTTQREAEPGVPQRNDLDRFFGLGLQRGSGPARLCTVLRSYVLPPVSAAIWSCTATLRTARCRSTGVVWHLEGALDRLLGDRIDDAHAVLAAGGRGKRVSNTPLRNCGQARAAGRCVAAGEPSAGRINSPWSFWFGEVLVRQRLEVGVVGLDGQQHLVVGLVAGGGRCGPRTASGCPGRGSAPGGGSSGPRTAGSTARRTCAAAATSR